MTPTTPAELTSPTQYQAVPDPDMGQVLVAGDWHGNTAWARTVIDRAARLGINVIVHVGDLAALWPRDTGASFTYKLQRMLQDADMYLVFIDGNHDNHTALRALPRDQDGFGVISTRVKGAGALTRIRWVPRGHRWTWTTPAGRTVRFGGLGGAFSIDWRHRKPGVTWWPGIEEVEPQDITILGDEPLDVLLTHDCPTGAVPPSTMRVPADDDARSRVSRDLLRQAVDATLPTVMFCGHWHTRRTYHLPYVDPVTRVEVLDMDGSAGNVVILDLDDLTCRPALAA